MNFVVARKSFVVFALVVCFATASFAGTSVSAAVFPSTTVPGATIVFHTGVVNTSSSSEAVSVTIHVKQPGTCVTSHLPSNAGTLLMTLPGKNTRLSTLSLTVPPAACAGTYGVVVTVKNSSGVVIATHTTSFTLNPVPPL